MSDLEDQIQQVLDSSVATVVPPPDLIQAVQRRYRRKMARAALASGAAVAVIAAAVAVTGLAGRAGSPGQQHSRAPTHRASVFPGGGRLLFAGRRGLKWLYPDGSIVRIASGFSDAQVSGT